MTRELGEARSEVAATEHLERATGFVVEAAPPQRRDLVVERLGHHCMREAKVTRTVRAVDDDGDGRGLVEG